MNERCANSFEWIEKFFSFAFLILLFKQCLSPYLDPDMWWHLRQGEEMLRAGLLTVDRFSFTFAGQPLINHEWLSEILMAGVYRVGGIYGLILIFTLLTLSVFLAVFKRMRTPVPASMVLVFAAVCAAEFSFGVRPQVLSLVGMVFFLNRIEACRDGQSAAKSLGWLIPASLLWANLHGAYLIGPLLLFFYGVIEWIEGGRRRDHPAQRARVKHFMFYGVACFAVTALNPCGVKIWLFPFLELASDTYQRHLIEWETVRFDALHYAPFILLVFVGLVGLWISRKRLRAADALLFLGTAMVSFGSARHIPLFAVISAPVIGRMFFREQESPDGSVESPKACRGVPGAVVLLVLSLLMAGMGLRDAGARWNYLKMDLYKQFPVRAVDYINQYQLQQQRGFNEYDWGGYLVWRGIPVFVDGRAGTVYSQEFLEATFRLAWQPEPWDRLAKTWSLDYALLNNHHPLTIYLEQHERWRKVYRDELASIFLGEDFIEKYQIRASPARDV